jgi:hypothetical protein
MPEPDLRTELSKVEAEPLLPIEKKLIGWSLGIGLTLLIILAIVNHFLPAATPARETKEKPPAAEATPVPAPAAPVAVTPPPLSAETPAAPVAAAPAAPAGETPAPPVVTTPAAPVAETPAAPVGAAPGVPTAAAAAPGTAVFPSAISPQPGDARRKTCLDQYHANAATNSNGGLKWNAYWKECKKRLKS